MKHIVRIFCILMLTLFSGNAMAQEAIKADFVKSENKTLTNKANANFPLEAKLIKGLPFELSFDVAITGAAETTAPSVNQWGSALLTAGTNPFGTPTDGFQLYLSAKGNNGGILKVNLGGQNFNFTNVVYNTDKFHVSLSYNGTTLRAEITNQAETTGSTTSTNPQVAEKTMTFGDLTSLSYALPAGMTVSNLKLEVLAYDIQRIATARVADLEGRQGNVGFPSVEACEELTKEATTGAEALQQYKDYLRFDNSEFDVVLPSPGKVYVLANVVRTSPVSSHYLTVNVGNALYLNPVAPNSEEQPRFQYYWVPVPGNAENKCSFVSVANNKKLAWSGVTDSGNEWTTQAGNSYGFVSLYADLPNVGPRYAAAYADGSGFGQECYASAKGQYISATNPFSTDFVLAEVTDLAAYEVEIQGLTGSETATITYTQSEDHSITHTLNNGGVLVISKDHESSLSSTEFEASAVTGKVAYIDISTASNTIVVTYSSFATVKEKASQQVQNARTRLTRFTGSALYSSDAITAAETGLSGAQTLFDNNDYSEAFVKLAETMETFYKSIDGKYVVIRNHSKNAEGNYLTTSGNTNLGTRVGTKAATGDYFGVYRLIYDANGAYQLENAYHGNYVGQITGAETVNSATSAVAPRWRGSYAFDLQGGDILNHADAYVISCTNGQSGNLAEGDNNTIAKTSEKTGTALWEIALVDVNTYATAYKTAVKTEGSFTARLGYSPKQSVYDALKAAIEAYPSMVTEPQLANALNTYINSQNEIALPVGGEYLTFTNKAYTTYHLDENLYELNSTTGALDLGNVWEVEYTDNKYYLKNVKTGLYMGTVEKSKQARMGIKCKQPYQFEASATNGYVALRDAGTNSFYSCLHIASSNSYKTVGWSADAAASQWSMEEVTPITLIGYLSDAAEAVHETLKTDATDYNMSHKGYYAKTTTEIENAKATYTWPETDDVNTAISQYNGAVTAFSDFNNAGKKIGDNEMLLIKTKSVTTAAGEGEYYVTQVLEDKNGAYEEKKVYGSMTNGLPNDATDFLLFSLWQLVPDGDYYKLYNFYTRHYLSKDVSLSDEASGRLGLTTDPEEAASFIVKPEHGCYVSLQRSDYEEMNNGFLYFSSFEKKAKRIDNGWTLGNSPMVTTGDNQNRVLFSLEPATKDHLEACLKSLLTYPIGAGIGEYTDVNAGKDNSYVNEVSRINSIFTRHEASTLIGDAYETALKNEAQRFAPTLANLKINLPQAGHYYRLYNINDGKRWYIANNTSGYYPNMTQANNEVDVQKANPNTVFYFDGEHLLAYGNGYYIGTNSTPWVMGGIGEKFTFKFANTGYTGKGCYSIKPQGRSYLYNNKTSGLNGWGSAFNERCEWYLEEVTDLPLVVSSLGYSTFYSARSHKIPDGVACYTAYTTEGDQTSGGKVILSLIRDNYIPANVAVLVKANQGTYYFSEPTGYIADRDYRNNLFLGQIETILSGYTADDCKQYTLQKLNDTVGFYKYTGATLAGFKGYMDIDSVPASAQGKPLMFSFDDEEATGISHLINIYKENAVYDLYGRKVKTPSSGIYIVNGKKVFINK